MTASLDEVYEEMLRGEFSSRGKHAAAHAAPSPLPALAEDAPAHGVHLAAGDAPIHDEFEAQAPPAAAEQGLAESEGPRGLARYRNAAMVGAGGLACAAVGAFLGGLGGYFTIAPAAAHPLASSVSPDGTPSANGTNGGAATSGTEAVVTAVLTSLSGSLTENAAPLQWLTSQSGSLPESTAATFTDLPGGGTTDGGTGDDAGAGAAATGSVCAVTTDLGLGCVLGSVTTALGNVGTLPSDPTEELSSLVPALDGVVTDVSGTLANLSSLLPISSLPLPAGGLPALGLPAIPGVPGLGGLGGLGALGSGLSGQGGVTGTLLSGTVTSLLDGVTSAVAGSGGSGATSPSLPSLPLGGSGSSVPGRGAGPPRPPRDGVGRRQGVEPDGEGLGWRIDRRDDHDADQQHDDHDDQRAHHHDGDRADSVSAGAGERPARHGGRYLRRRQYRWIGLRADPLPPLGASFHDLHGPPIACGSTGRAHCAGRTGQEVHWSGSPACFVGRTVSRRPRFTPTGRRCTAH